MTVWRAVLLGTLIVDGLVLGLALGVYATVAPMVPDEATLGNYRPQETTRIFAKDGTLLAALFVENRQVVPVTSMPRNLVNATIAIEDQRFYEHPGVDPRGIARAIKENASRSSKQGASTITQQLARQVFLSREQTMLRKFKEMTLAVRIERRFSKEEILGLYLNEICYGHRAYGVVAAADTFFGKKLDQLTLGECAMIAGLAKNPVGYSPILHPESAKGRRNMVLQKMWEQRKISQQQLDEARAEPVVVRKKGAEPWKLHNYRAPWFTTYVIDQLEKQFGHDKVYGGGLQIYTTLDLDLQAEAQELLSRSMANLAHARANRGAVVALEPRTGAILAMVGGRDFSKDEFNGATQAFRQPGSSFKPIVYTTAMEKIGLSPYDYYSGAPSTFRGYWGVYSPQNFSPNQGGTMSVATALAQSVNLVAVRVIIKTGPQAVIEQAHRMGIDERGKRLQPYPSLALGSGEVTPLEMSNAYCAFANGGFRVDAYGVDCITDSRGNPIFNHQVRSRRVMSPRTYTNMNSMLQGVVANGTGKRAAINSPCGGKTGTTNSAKDVWFVGITPGLACAVWIGNDSNIRMYGATGGDFCAPIWRTMALRARELARERNRAWPDDFPRPGEEGPPSIAQTGNANAEEQKKEEKAEQKTEVKGPAGPTAATVDPNPPTTQDGKGTPGATVTDPTANAGRATTGGNGDEGPHAVEPGPKPEPKPDPKPDPKPEPKPDPKPEPKPKPAPNPAPNEAPDPG